MGIFVEEKKGILESRLVFFRGPRPSQSLSLSSHLSFFAASGASPRGFAAAAALELLVTVTPKRRSDFWTARSAMIFRSFCVSVKIGILQFRSRSAPH